MKCKAYRSSTGEMICDHCGLLWDYDDNEPPSCKININKPVNKPIKRSSSSSLTALNALINVHHRYYND